MNDIDVLEKIKDIVESKGSVSTSALRSESRIGYSRAKRLLKFLADNGQIRHQKGKGYIATNKFNNKLTDREKEAYEKNTKEVMDAKWENDNHRTVQLLRDKNTRLSRLLRNNYRNKNMVDGIVDGIKEHIDIINHDYTVIQPTCIIQNKVGIVQLSDGHLQEMVRPETVKGSNVYNWDIASKRMQKYAWEVKKYLEFHEISEIILVITGDMFNSPRRYDEAVDNQDSTSVSLLIGVDLLTNFILDICKMSNDCVRVCSVYSVFGNESRIKEDYTSVHWEDSFDYLLHQITAIKFEDTKYVRFEQPTVDHSTVIKDVMGANILLIHGHNRTNFSKELEKYATNPDLTKRLVIDYMLWGHIHSTKVEERSRRSASLVGNNAYSYHRLGLQGSAEQNLHILTKESKNRIPTMQTITINLDYTDNIPGYPLSREQLYRQGSTRKYTSI